MSALGTLAEKAQAASERLAGPDGVTAKLPDDPTFLRKVKPALTRKRLRGRKPSDQLPREVPDGPGGPNPFVVIGIALALGVLAAKVIDWRSHGHPRW